MAEHDFESVAERVAAAADMAALDAFNRCGPPAARAARAFGVKQPWLHALSPAHACAAPAARLRALLAPPADGHGYTVPACVRSCVNHGSFTVFCGSFALSRIGLRLCTLPLTHALLSRFSAPPESRQVTEELRAIVADTAATGAMRRVGTLHCLRRFAELRAASCVGALAR